MLLEILDLVQVAHAHRRLGELVQLLKVCFGNLKFDFKLNLEFLCQIDVWSISYRDHDELFDVRLLLLCAGLREDGV